LITGNPISKQAIPDIYINFTASLSDIYNQRLQLKIITEGVGSLLAGVQSGLIASQTIAVNANLTYQLQLISLKRHQPAFLTRLTATTLLGTLTVNQERFTDLITARKSYQDYVAGLTD